MIKSLEVSVAGDFELRVAFPQVWRGCSMGARCSREAVRCWSP